MPRFSLIQLFMGTAFVAIVLMFSQINDGGGALSSIDGLCFSADGTRMLVQHTTAREARTPDVSELMDVGRCLSWLDAQTGETLRIVNQEFWAGNQGATAKVMPMDPISVAYIPDSDVAITTSFDSDELIFYSPYSDLTSLPKRLKLSHPANHLVLSRSGRLLAACGGHDVTIVDTNLQKLLLRLPENGEPFESVHVAAFTMDEKQLAIIDDHQLQLWVIDTGQPAKEVVELGQNLVYQTGFMALDDTLVVDAIRTLLRYDLNGTEIARYVNDSLSSNASLSRDGKLMAFSVDKLDSGSRVDIFNMETNEINKSFTESFVHSMGFSPGNQRFVCTRGNRLLCFDLATKAKQWEQIPPDAYRSPWPLPFSILALWCIAASWLGWRTRRRKRAKAASESVAENVS